jgi:hypothetical protein
LRSSVAAILVSILVIGGASAVFLFEGTSFIGMSSTSLASSLVSNSSSNSHNTFTSMVNSTTASTEGVSANPTSGQLGAWQQTSSYPGSNPPSSCMIAVGNIYCVGGNGNATYFAPVSSGGAGKWERSTDYPIPVQDERCVGSSNFIYCVGGVSSAPSARAADPYGRTPDVFYAQVSVSGMGRWASTTPFPYVIDDPRCMTYSASIYCVVAGFNGTAYTSSTATFIAPLSASGLGAWSRSAGPPSMTAGCSVLDGYVYCFGGGNCPPAGPNSDCYSPSYSTSLSSNGVGTWGKATELPTAGWAVYVTAESYIYYFVTPIFFAQVSAGGIGPWESATNFPSSFYPGACASSGNYIYCVGSNKDGVYYSQVGGPNPGSLVLQNPPPFTRAQYLVPAFGSGGGCSVTVNGTLAGAPCFGSNIESAVIFNCAASAATSSGCTTTVISPGYTAYNYNVTIWYPDPNAPSPNSNCEFLPSLGYKAPFNAWCISISQSSFIIAQPVELQTGQP